MDFSHILLVSLETLRVRLKKKIVMHVMKTETYLVPKTIDIKKREFLREGVSVAAMQRGRSSHTEVVGSMLYSF